MSDLLSSDIDQLTSAGWTVSFEISDEGVFCELRRESGREMYYADGETMFEALQAAMSRAGLN